MSTELLLLWIAASVAFYLKSDSVNKSVSLAQTNFTLKEKRVSETLNWLGSQISQNSLDFNEALLSESDYLVKEGIVLLAYRNDSIKFWTSNLAPIDQSIREVRNNEGMLHLRNGWYYYELRQNKNVKLFGLLLISKEYDVQNSYFKNGFVSWLSLGGNCKLNLSAAKENSILSASKKPLFGIGKQEGSISEKTSLPGILFFGGLLILAINLINYSFTARQVATLTKGPKTAADFNAAATQLARNGVLATAVLHWQNAAAKAPEQLAYQESLGRAYAQLGFFERSLDVLQGALKRSGSAERQAAIQQQITAVQAKMEQQTQQAK